MLKRCILTLCLAFTILAATSQNYRINEIMSSNGGVINDKYGVSSDWIELYNAGGITGSLKGYGLSDEKRNPFKWTFPEFTFYRGAYLIVFASGIELKVGEFHTNFKLNAEGESLYFTDPQGLIVDSVRFGSLDENTSLGRRLDDPTKWGIFTTSTPKKENRGLWYHPEDVGVPVFSKSGCVTKSGVTISINSPHINDTIYYTTDGSEPSFSSGIVNKPFEIKVTKIIKARILKKGMIPGKTVTNSYIVYDINKLPVVSLSMNPSDLWDFNTGIYVNGPNYDEPMPHYGANYWQDWEKLCHLELFENGTDQVISQDAGVKIFGNWSRVNAQKSMAIHARNEYGADLIRYKIFENRPFDEFKSIVLRNSGNDWNNTMFRDGLMTSLTIGLNIDQMAYRPSIIFLNGSYWGILNIREKINEHFIASNHEVNAVDVIMGENYDTVLLGTNTDWMNLTSFIDNNSLIGSVNYNQVASQIEINSFIDYFASQIFYANHDWPGNNIRYWKTTDPTSKWRWIIYDTDFGFGGISGTYVSNSLAAATATNGPGWPNPPWSTLFLRKLLENAEFRNQFVNRYADLLNSTFLPDRVNGTIDKMRDKIVNEIGNHLMHWSASNQATWLSNVQVLKTFASKRPANVFKHIQQKFSFQPQIPINVSGDSKAGSVQLNSLKLTEFPWQGYYFQEVPVTLTAIPNAGYRFLRWEGVNTGSNMQTISVNPKTGMQITAIFESDGSHYENIVINEISFNNAVTPDPGDWIEIFNKGSQDIDLSGFKMTDSDTSHFFIFPTNTWIKSNDFLVVSNDLTKIKSVFGNVNNLFGPFYFGLGNITDTVRLFSKFNDLIDEVGYSNITPWKPFNLNELWSLELLSPLKDNNTGENWDFSVNYGTPGLRNTPYIPDAADELTLPVQRFELSQNYPSPFTEGTYIEFRLGEPGKYRLSVLDINGRTIRNLTDDDLFSTMHILYWDGKDESGKAVSSGVYFYRLDSKGFSEMKRMIKI
jgi:hypothetical protein